MEQAPSRVIQIPTPDTALRLFTVYPALTPAEVFARWTQPHLLTRWWPQTAEVDAREGGAYTLGWPREMQSTLHGVYYTVTPNRELRFSWSWSFEVDVRIVTVRLKPAPEGGTRLDLEHGSYLLTLDDQTARIENHLAGWGHFLPRLDSF